MHYKNTVRTILNALPESDKTSLGGLKFQVKEDSKGMVTLEWNCPSQLNLYVDIGPEYIIKNNNPVFYLYYYLTYNGTPTDIGEPKGMGQVLFENNTIPEVIIINLKMLMSFFKK